MCKLPEKTNKMNMNMRHTIKGINFFSCLFPGFPAGVCLLPDRRVGICGDPPGSWNPFMNSLAGAYFKMRERVSISFEGMQIN
jgi:hypothetical protein